MGNNEIEQSFFLEEEKKEEEVEELEIKNDDDLDEKKVANSFFLFSFAQKELSVSLSPTLRPFISLETMGKRDYDPGKAYQRERAEERERKRERQDN